MKQESGPDQSSCIGFVEGGVSYLVDPETRKVYRGSEEVPPAEAARVYAAYRNFGSLGY